jgi:hypothetical protein
MSLAMACRPFEDFPAVPRKMLRRGFPFWSLRLSCRPAVMTHQAILKTGAAVGLF